MSAGIVKALAMLKDAYPRQAIEPATLKVYAEMLSDISPEELLRVVKRIIATSKWFPTIAEIREEMTNEIFGDRPPPELAWDEVMREAARVGTYKAPVFSCDEIHRAVRAIGGWNYVCLTETNGYDIKRFAEAYRAALEQTQWHAQLGPKLSGDVASTNELVGNLAKQLTRGKPE